MSLAMPALEDDALLVCHRIAGRSTIEFMLVAIDVGITLRRGSGIYRAGYPGLLSGLLGGIHRVGALCFS
jgi:hypothetical protein